MPRHEYYKTQREPYEGSAEIYKVYGVKTWEELADYAKKFEMRPVILNGSFVMVGKMKEFTD